MSVGISERGGLSQPLAPEASAHRRLFAGVIRSAGVATRLTNPEIGEALRRFRNGDWGEVPEVVVMRNRQFLEKCYGSVRAQYYSERNVPFVLLSTEDQKDVVMFLPDEESTRPA